MANHWGVKLCKTRNRCAENRTVIEWTDATNRIYRQPRTFLFFLAPLSMPIAVAATPVLGFFVGGLEQGFVRYFAHASNPQLQIQGTRCKDNSTRYRRFPLISSCEISLAFFNIYGYITNSQLKVTRSLLAWSLSWYPVQAWIFFFRL